MANIVIVVFDGLQPAQVTPELMPNLSRLAAEGVTGGNHHAVFPTVTRANVASIVTGHHPGAHGLTGNMLVIPEFDPHNAINALEPTLTQKSLPQTSCAAATDPRRHSPPPRAGIHRHRAPARRATPTCKTPMPKPAAALPSTPISACPDHCMAR